MTLLDYTREIKAFHFGVLGHYQNNDICLSSFIPPTATAAIVAGYRALGQFSLRSIAPARRPFNVGE